MKNTKMMQVLLNFSLWSCFITFFNIWSPASFSMLLPGSPHISSKSQVTQQHGGSDLLRDGQASTLPCLPPLGPLWTGLLLAAGERQSPHTGASHPVFSLR